MLWKVTNTLLSDFSCQRNKQSVLGVQFSYGVPCSSCYHGKEVMSFVAAAHIQLTF